jgi:hypothetical protein
LAEISVPAVDVSQASPLLGESAAFPGGRDVPAAGLDFIRVSLIAVVGPAFVSRVVVLLGRFRVRVRFSLAVAVFSVIAIASIGFAAAVGFSITRILIGRILAVGRFWRVLFRLVEVRIARADSEDQLVRSWGREVVPVISAGSTGSDIRSADVEAFRFAAARWLVSVIPVLRV